jgi:hypothetical protein
MLAIYTIPCIPVCGQAGALGLPNEVKVSIFEFWKAFLVFKD